MKRFILFSLMLLGLSYSVKADNSTDPQKNQMVTISKGDYTNTPRDAGAVPILCEYQNGILVLQYLKDIGDLGIAVSNLQTGKYEFVYVSSKEGVTYIDLNGGSGDYYMEIVTSYGEWYYAYFTIN